VLVTGVAISVVGFGVMLGAVTYGLFLLAAVIIDIRGGLWFVPMRAVLADIFESRCGLAYGVNKAVGSGGVLIATGLSLVILRVTSWRHAFLPPLVLLGGCGVALHAFSHEAYVLSRFQLGLRNTADRVLGDG
jgi:MFS family permease